MAFSVFCVNDHTQFANALFRVEEAYVRDGKEGWFHKKGNLLVPSVFDLIDRYSWCSASVVNPNDSASEDADILVATSLKTKEGVWFFQGWLRFDDYLHVHPFCKVALGCYIPSVMSGHLTYMTGDVLKEETDSRRKLKLPPLPAYAYFMSWKPLPDEDENIFIRALTHLEIDTSKYE